MSDYLLPYSMFQDVLFPRKEAQNSDGGDELSLRRIVSFSPHANLFLKDVPLVVFDLETTGLDHRQDYIVEMGAQKIVGGQVVGEFETMVDPERDMPEDAQKVTGITPDMLVGQPKIQEILPKFFKFIEGSLLVAHNASFDMGFIRHHSSLLGIEFDWPSFCTLKLARELLPDLKRKNLDTLAEHYGLSFESRHRSIGDVKVTVSVLQELMNQEGSHLKTWQDMEPYRV